MIILCANGSTKYNFNTLYKKQPTMEPPMDPVENLVKEVKNLSINTEVKPEPVPAAAGKAAAKKKLRETMYWAVEVDLNIVLAHEPVKKTLDANPQLLPLKKMHSTLLFVGGDKKITDELRTNEEVYMTDMGKECQLTVSGHGHSPNAMALKVDSVNFVETNNAVKSYSAQQHVTVALAKDIKAVDSVKTLTEKDSSEFVAYDKPLVLKGKLVRNFF